MSNLPVNVPIQEIQPDHRVGNYELICHLRKTSTVLYGIFTEVIRQFYSQELNLPLPIPGVVWDPDPAKTKIWIDTELRWEDEHPSMRPAIFAALGPVTYNSLTGRSDGFAGMNLKEGEYEYSRSGNGSVTFRHIGSTDGEACVLADATLDYLDAFGQQIRDDFCFTKFHLAQRVANMSRGKESGERWGSSVECAFEFEDRWRVKLESRRLRRVSFNAGQGLIAGV